MCGSQLTMVPTEIIGLLMKFFPYLNASCFGSIEHPTHKAKLRYVGEDQNSNDDLVC